MCAEEFVDALIDAGRVHVEPALDEPEGLREAVLALDRAARIELGSNGLSLVPEVGEWALLLLYRACQSLVYRELEADFVRAALAQPCPCPPSPDVCFSADLALRFLPDLTGLARGIAEEDPLVSGLIALAARWPLSSVGMRGLEGLDDLAPFIDHPGLRRLYADRIIERGDAARLTDPRARAAVREAIGGFPQLAPKLSAVLAEER